MNIHEPFVITVSREMGSGGRTIGRKLAAQLGVRFSDKDLITALRAKYGLTTFEIEQIKAKKKNWLADMLELVAPLPNNGAFISPQLPTGSPNPNRVSQDDVFQTEAEIVKAIAAEGSCVITGRSGFFILKDHPNKLDIFVRAPRENRIKRVMERQSLTREQAETIIDSVDKGRETYVKQYAGTSRYDCRNYDLVVNMDNLTEDEAVAGILKYIKHVSK